MPMMVKLKENRHEITTSAAQFSLTIIFVKEDLIWFLGTLRILITKSRYGNQNNQTPYWQTGSNLDRNKNSNLYRQYHQDRSSNFGNLGPNNSQQTQCIFNAKPENSDTQ